MVIDSGIEGAAWKGAGGDADGTADFGEASGFAGVLSLAGGVDDMAAGVLAEGCVALSDELFGDVFAEARLSCAGTADAPAGAAELNG